MVSVYWGQNTRQVNHSITDERKKEGGSHPVTHNRFQSPILDEISDIFLLLQKCPIFSNTKFKLVSCTRSSMYCPVRVPLSSTQHLYHLMILI